MQARAASQRLKAQASSHARKHELLTRAAITGAPRTRRTPRSILLLHLNPPPPPPPPPPLASLLWAGGWCTVLAPALGLPASWSALSLVCYMLVVAVWRHPTAISIAWSGLQLVAQGGMPRDLDSLVAEVKTLLCLLVALHCFQDLLERLSRHWWMHAHVWSMGEGVGHAIGRFECRPLTRRLT